MTEGGTKPGRQRSRRRMSKDPIKSKVRREELFNAIAKVMVERRSGILTVDEIASRLGMTKGTLYYYFNSKGEMHQEMQKYARQIVEQAVTPILRDKTIPPRERLERAIRNYVMTTCQHWQLSRSAWMDLDIKEVRADRRRVTGLRRSKFEEEFFELIREIIEAEQITGVHATTAARLIFGIISSITLWYREGGTLSAQEIADYVVRSVFSGVL